MLQQFFTSIIILMVFLIAFIIIKMVVPMWRFMVRADTVIKLYVMFKEILKMDLSEIEEIDIECGKYKYQLKIDNLNEFIIEFEKLINETLKCYDKLGWMANVEGTDFKVQKDEVNRICSEVRTLIWPNQES